MSAASAAPTMPSVTPGSTSPSTSPTKNAPTAGSHTKAQSFLRWALFEAAVHAARRGSPDRSYYLQVAERIDHKRACFSVARKLCRRAFHILPELGDDALAFVDYVEQVEAATAAA
jgi:hypothetical protein